MLSNYESLFAVERSDYVDLNTACKDYVHLILFFLVQTLFLMLVVWPICLQWLRLETEELMVMFIEPARYMYINLHVRCKLATRPIVQEGACEKSFLYRFRKKLRS